MEPYVIILQRSHRLVLSLIFSFAMAMVLSLVTVPRSIASSATGGTCCYTNVGEFVGTYCEGATYFTTEHC
jgi:hypothetical protein